MSEAPPIVVTGDRLPAEEVARLVSLYFGDMVKFVADLALGQLAVGGDLHADAEQLLLERGSAQSDLWGGNYYPGRGESNCIEYTSLINIRPSQGNRGMLLEDTDLRRRVDEIVYRVLGRGEPLA